MVASKEGAEGVVMQEELATPEEALATSAEDSAVVVDSMLGIRSSPQTRCI